MFYKHANVITIMNIIIYNNLILIRNPDYMARHSVEYYHDHFLSTGRISVLHNPDKFGRVVVVCKAGTLFIRQQL